MIFVGMVGARWAHVTPAWSAGGSGLGCSGETFRSSLTGCTPYRPLALSIRWVLVARKIRYVVFPVVGAVNFAFFDAIASLAPVPGGGIGDGPGSTWIIVLVLGGVLIAIASSVWARLR